MKKNLAYRGQQDVTFGNLIASNDDDYEILEKFFC